MLHSLYRSREETMSLHKIHRRRIADDAEVNMTPMLDIVFIMLIFFIVTATFLDESGLNLEVPPDGPIGNPVKSIAVYVSNKNTISVNGVATELTAVPLRVERLIAENPKATVSLRAAPQAALDPVVYIKDQMVLAGRQTVITIDKRS